jgi:hypothetical protein
MSKLKRFDDWPERLDKFFRANARTPFSWGVFDCCLFAADAIQAMTGTDLAAAYRGKYSSEEEAMALAGSIQGVCESVTTEFNLVEVRPSFSQRGDLVVFQQAQNQLVGLIALNSLIIYPSATGLSFSPRSAQLRAWRVG